MSDQHTRWEESLEELAVFGLGGGTESDGSGGGGTAELVSPLGDKVRSTIKNILGARVRTDDPQGFRASLAQAFAPREVHGRREYRWTPRSYSIEVERGTLTGAQASIFTRANRALEHSVALLDGLKATSCECDEGFESARTVVRAQLGELVSELGNPGGPRPGRVDVLFDQLHHQLRHLKEALRFDQTMCTVEEEEIATNLEIVKDYVDSLEASWQGSRDHFLIGGTGRYLGSVQYHLKRHLAVMVESVDEAHRIMNKAMLGPRERETLLLPLVVHVHEQECDACTDECKQQELYLADLLHWVEHFGGKEAPRLLAEGGCYGGQVVRDTLRRLTQLTEETVHLSCESREPRGRKRKPQEPLCAPAAFYSARVRFALQQVHEHVRQASALAESLPCVPHEDRRRKKDRGPESARTPEAQERPYAWFRVKQAVPSQRGSEETAHREKSRSQTDDAPGSSPSAIGEGEPHHETHEDKGGRKHEKKPRPDDPKHA